MPQNSLFFCFEASLSPLAVKGQSALDVVGVWDGVYMCYCVVELETKIPLSLISHLF